LSSQPPVPLRAERGSRRSEPAEYDDAVLDRLADRLVDRLVVRLGALIPERVDPLVDAVEIARMLGRTRSWVCEHADELGAVRLGSGPRPRLGFSPVRAAAQPEQANEPAPLTLPQQANPRRSRRRRTDRTASGARCSVSAATTATDRGRPATTPRRTLAFSGPRDPSRRTCQLARSPDPNRRPSVP